MGSFIGYGVVGVAITSLVVHLSLRDQRQSNTENEEDRPSVALTVLSGTAVGLVLSMAAVLVLFLVSYALQQRSTETIQLEKLEGHDYYAEAVGDMSFIIRPHQRRETEEVKVSYWTFDLEPGQPAQLERQGYRPGWFQKIFPSPWPGSVVLHLAPPARDLAWFENQAALIEALDAQTAALQLSPREAAYLPEGLSAQLRELDDEDLSHIIVLRDILATLYNREAGVLDESTFPHTLYFRPELEKELVPYQFEIIGDYK